MYLDLALLHLSRRIKCHGNTNEHDQPHFFDCCVIVATHHPQLKRGANPKTANPLEDTTAAICGVAAAHLPCAVSFIRIAHTDRLAPSTSSS